MLPTCQHATWCWECNWFVCKLSEVAALSLCPIQRLCWHHVHTAATWTHLSVTCRDLLKAVCLAAEQDACEFSDALAELQIAVLCQPESAVGV